MQEEISLNTKADIPITILVLGVFVICALAITSFMIFKVEGSRDSLGIELFQEINTDMEKFNFYQNVGFSLVQSADKINATISGNQLIIEKNNTMIFIKYTKTLE